MSPCRCSWCLVVLLLYRARTTLNVNIAVKQHLNVFIIFRIKKVSNNSSKRRDFFVVLLLLLLFSILDFYFTFSLRLLTPCTRIYLNVPLLLLLLLAYLFKTTTTIVGLLFDSHSHWFVRFFSCLIFAVVVVLVVCTFVCITDRVQVGTAIRRRDRYGCTASAPAINGNFNQMWCKIFTRLFIGFFGLVWFFRQNWILLVVVLLLVASTEERERTKHGAREKTKCKCKSAACFFFIHMNTFYNSISNISQHINNNNNNNNTDDKCPILRMQMQSFACVRTRPNWIVGVFQFGGSFIRSVFLHYFQNDKFHERTHLCSCSIDALSLSLSVSKRCVFMLKMLAKSCKIRNDLVRLRLDHPTNVSIRQNVHWIMISLDARSLANCNCFPLRPINELNSMVLCVCRWFLLNLKTTNLCAEIWLAHKTQT